MTAATTRAANWRLHFISFWTGQAVSLFGTSLVQFALIWWLTSATHSATVLATATLASMLPGIILAPAAGVWVDRWNRRWVMILSDALVALASLVLIVLFALGAAQVWQVFVLAFIRAAGNAFQLPAMTASTSLMVPEDQLARVSGFNQSLQGGMSIVAPPVGALLLQTVPMAAILSIDVVTALMGILPLFFIHVPQPVARGANSRSSVAGRTLAAGRPSAAPSFWQEMRAGFAYLLAWPGALILVGMALVLNFLFSPTGPLTPILVTQYFHGGAGQLAGLDSASGVGVVAGGIVLGLWGGFHRRILTTLTALIGLSVAIGAIGLLPPGLFWLAVVAMFVSSAMQAMTNGPIMAVLQASVAPDMQGRVFSLVTALATAIVPLGLLVAGPFSDVFGPRAWFVGAGVLGALIGLAGFFMPALLHIEDQAVANAAPAAPLALPGESS